MKPKLYLTLLILLTFPLSAFEITLDNGDAFICDLITETDKSFKILHKSKEYTIPKTEVASTDSTKKGNSAFRYSKFILKDGIVFFHTVEVIQTPSDIKEIKKCVIDNEANGK